MSLSTTPWIALACSCAVFLSPVMAQERPEPFGQLAALGPQARSAWPALAELVDQARAGSPDERDLLKARYGRKRPTRKQAKRDWLAVGEALEALQLLEQAAAQRGAPSFVYAGVQAQVLGALRRGLREATPRDVTPQPLADPRQSGRSWGETLSGVNTAEGRAFGAVRATLLLLGAVRSAELPSGPALGERYLETLADAGRAQCYGLRGSQLSGPSYAGSAAVETTDGELTLWRSVGGAQLRGALQRQGTRWVVEAPLLTSAGLVGLGANPTEGLVFRAHYVAIGGTLLGSWRIADAQGDTLTSGSETLVPRDGAPSDAQALLGMSELMAKIVASALPRAAKGTVPRRLMLTTRNTTNHQALLNGPEIFAEYERLIGEAKQEVLVQTFVWEVESEAAKRALAALRTLEGRMIAGAPARVRFMRNKHRFATGGFKAVRDMIEQFEGAGLDPQRVDVEVRGYKHTLLDNLHGKALVVDGEHAVLTGANFEVCHDAGTPWFDAGFGVSGDVAWALRHEFAQGWHKATGEWLPAGKRAPAAGSIPMLLATSKGRGSPFTNASDDPQAAAFATAFREATTVVRFQTPNLNDDVIKDAIVHALLKGVRVEGIVSHTFNQTGESLPGRGGGNAANVAELYRRAREEGGEDAVRLLDLRWYAATDGTVIVGNGPLASHAKYASFDHQVAIVGSCNLDTTSINNSREVNVVIDDSDTVQAWDGRLFEPNFERAGRARPKLIDAPLGE